MDVTEHSSLCAINSTGHRGPCTCETVALRELVDAVGPQLGTMNFYFGPGARTAVSSESITAYRRIKAAVERGKAVLDGSDSPRPEPPVSSAASSCLCRNFGPVEYREVERRCPLHGVVGNAIRAIRNGADYSLHGMTLTVNGVVLALTDVEFDLVYDVMDEVDGDDWRLSLA